MKQLMVMAVLAVAPMGCVANQGDASVRFLNTRALESGDGCSASAEAFVSRGRLDVSGGQNYLIAPSVETNTVNQPIIIDQETQSDTGLGDITLTELIYSYQVSSGEGISLPADEVDRVPIYAVFRPETDPDESYLFMHAFGPEAFKRLTPDAIGVGKEVIVLSTIKARGYMSGGQTVESNEFTFPVTVSNSGYERDNTVDPCPLVPTNTATPGTCGIFGQDIDICR